MTVKTTLLFFVFVWLILALRLSFGRYNINMRTQVGSRDGCADNVIAGGENGLINENFSSERL